MVGRELAVDEWVGATEIERRVAAVVLGLLLLDDVGLDRHSEVIRLPREIGRKGIVGCGVLKAALRR